MPFPISEFSSENSSSSREISKSFSNPLLYLLNSSGGIKPNFFDFSFISLIFSSIAFSFIVISLLYCSEFNNISIAFCWSGFTVSNFEKSLFL